MTEVDNTNLFVGNFSRNLSEEDMRELFSVYGELEDVRLIMDRMTGRSKGFGFVKFVNEDDATTALAELNDKEVDGRELKITVAKPREERPQREENNNQ